MPLLMQSELLRAWDDVLSFVGKRRTVSAAGNARLKTILQMIDERYMEKLSLQDFARSVSLSPGECERFFKKGTGASLFQYLMQVRIGKSKELLRNTDGSVAEIAQASGFSSQSYFTVCFKRMENCTPLQYRKKMEARPKEKSAQTVL